MSYRAWPAALLTGASLAAACFVVGDHVVAASDGCLDSAGWFTATPAARTGNAVAARTTGKPAADPYKIDTGSPETVNGIGDTGDQPTPGEKQISGCLDLDRIEIPAPTPDGRA